MSLINYLDKPCPNCGNKKLFEDNCGDGVYHKFSCWIQCDSCEHDFNHNECGYKYAWPHNPVPIEDWDNFKKEHNYI